MNLKKNALSYFAWMIILLFTAAAFSFFGMISAHLFEFDSPLIAVGFIVIFFGVVCFIYFLTGCIMKCVKPGKLITSVRLTRGLETAIVFLCIAAGVAVRIYLLPTAGEEAAYFDVCKVTGENSIPIQAVQGSVYYYCMLLHGLFMIVGNHWIAGIWLQILLQTIGIFLMYLVVRKLTDSLPAIAVLVFTCFAPVSVQAGLTYSPEMLYFCIFALGFLLVADYLKHSETKEKYPVLMWLYTVMIGMVIGFICYVDVSGLILLLPVLCLFHVKRSESRILIWSLRFILVLLCAVGSFALFLLLDALLSDATFLSVLNAWITTYTSFGLNAEMLTGEINIELPILIWLISFGVFSFWRRKNAERFTIPVLMVCGIFLLHFSSITADNMDGRYLLYILMAFLAGVCVMEMFYRSAADTAKIPVEISVDNAANTEVGTVQFFENPLPLPKKHVKKVMDYAMLPAADKMNYDVEVTDTDDYDIKE